MTRRIKVSNGFVAINPSDSPLLDTVSARPVSVRQILGESFNSADWRNGWKKAYKQGYRVAPCDVAASIKVTASRP